jgi:hypothetical protein
MVEVVYCCGRECKDPSNCVVLVFSTWSIWVGPCKFDGCGLWKLTQLDRGKDWGSLSTTISCPYSSIALVSQVLFWLDKWLFGCSIGDLAHCVVAAVLVTIRWGSLLIFAGQATFKRVIQDQVIWVHPPSSGMHLRCSNMWWWRSPYACGGLIALFLEHRAEHVFH